MDWEPTHNLKRKADWYYNIDSKQRRLNPSHEREEHEKRIYQFLDSPVPLTVKLTTLIRENEFEIFAEYVSRIYKNKIKETYNFLDVGQAILDSDNRKFYDFFLTYAPTHRSPSTYLLCALYPPNFKRYIQLEEYGGLPLPHIIINSVSFHCEATQILEYVLNKYKFDYNTYMRVATKSIKKECSINLGSILFYMIDHKLHNKDMFQVLREVANKSNNSKILGIINEYETFAERRENYYQF